MHVTLYLKQIAFIKGINQKMYALKFRKRSFNEYMWNADEKKRNKTKPNHIRIVNIQTKSLKWRVYGEDEHEILFCK